MGAFRYPYEVKETLEPWRETLGLEFEAVTTRLTDRDRALEDYINGYQWTSYTPAFTASGGVPGGAAPTLAGYYSKMGRTLSVTLDFTYVGAMILPAGNYFLSLPLGLTAKTGRFAPGVAMYHTGAAPFAGTCSPYYAAAGGTKLAVSFNGVGAGWGLNSPVVPAVGHVLTMTWIGETTT